MRSFLLIAAFVIGLVSVAMGVHRYFVALGQGTSEMTGLAYRVIDVFPVCEGKGCGGRHKERWEAVLHYEVTTTPSIVKEQETFEVKLTLREPEPTDEPNVISLNKSKEASFPWISANRTGKIQFELSQSDQDVTISPQGFTPVTVTPSTKRLMGSVVWSITAGSSRPLRLILNSNLSSNIADAFDIVLDRPLEVPTIHVEATGTARWDRARPSLVYFLGSFLTLPGIVALFLKLRRQTGGSPIDV
jgi:hypothetical protein